MGGCLEHEEQRRVLMKTTIGVIRKLIREMSDREVSPPEVLATWEDLYVNSLRNKRKGDVRGVTPGEVSLEELMSWLQSNNEPAVRRAIVKAGLVVDKDNSVVQRGMSVPSPRG